MADPLSDAVLVADPEPVAHARRRFSTSSQQGKPQLPPHTANSQDAASGAAVDPDTCRICRGEASAEEPLFYPCKCSGSIKYVHQDCLMEWLSHSQKKHCELCKTPFRFTKLYDRRMPQTLPFVVFISHVAKYMLNNVLVWLRAALVVSMWLVWLPYLMRSIWSLMFWISDEGFGGGAASLFGAPEAEDQVCRLEESPLVAAASSLAGGACPANPLIAPSRSLLAAAATTTSPAIASATSHLMDAKNTLTRETQFGTALIPETLYADVLRMILESLGLSNGTAETLSIDPAMTSATAALSQQVARNHTSLLSDVKFLNNLTSRPWINRNLIYVLEGQIITILVIVCFILIILVRDYVVLQQPEINMRAAFAAAENQPVPRAAHAELENPAAGLRAEDIDALRGPDLGGDDEDVEAGSIDSARAEDGSAHQDGELAHDQDPREDLAPLHTPVYRRRPFQSDQDNGEEASTSRASRTFTGENPLANSGARASADNRGAPNTTFAHAPLDEVLPLSVKEYTEIHREAHGDVHEMLKIFRERGLEARAEPWLRLRRDIRTTSRGESTRVPDGNKTDSPDENESLEPNESVASATVQTLASSRRDSDQSSSDWTLPSDSLDDDASQVGKGKQKAVVQRDDVSTDVGASSSSAGKGKEREVEDIPSLAGPHLRPRANTDGSFRSGGPHPLANNTWAFPRLDYVPSAESPSVQPRAKEEAPTSTDDGLVEDGGLTRHPQLGPDERPEDETPELGEGVDWAVVPDFNDPPVHHPVHAEAQPEVRQAVGILERLNDFMWRDVNPADDMQDRARFRALLGDGDNDGDQDFVDLPENQDIGEGEGGNLDEDQGHNQDEGAAPAQLPPPPPPLQQPERDPEAVRAAVAAGLDPEAIDDAEDFEGVMELLGMRGPVAGLFQNAIFCSFLVSVTVFAGIFVPYNIGRVCVWVLANPTRPLRILFSAVKLVQDCALVAVGLASWFTLRVANMLSPLLAVQNLSRDYVMPLVRALYYMSVDAARRIVDSFTVEPPVISTSEIRNFSAISHEALLVMKANFTFVFSTVAKALVFVFGGNYASKGTEVVSFVSNATTATWDGLKQVPAVVTDPGSWVINLSPNEPPVAINPGLAYWDGTDRFWAVLGGYLALCIVAALYLHRGRPFSSSPAGQEREASIVDGLNQASGVMKVILIIGIEMLIFPLYCGLLLDVALLPLFENTTLRSRVLFTYNYPLTSIFVHWFVGTGYMFHFALFVSMCRKIMRKGVLYFIRDPDDPEFHPVRDVLERNVTTQLRKILFSAFVYGALVMICLGGVVWGLWVSLPGVLPIHYSSNEPVLEFPIDLLFYNFLMPLAVKFFRPSDGLHSMYTWWFRKCARVLRVTWFLFGERRIDEEGILVLEPNSPHRKLPFWRRMFLEVDNSGEVVPKKWDDTFEIGKTETTADMKPDELATLALRKALLTQSKQIIPDGRFVRTPASDQVKIPKGRGVFLEVSEANVRSDGRPDGAETDLYSTKQYQLVYIPPHFRLRVFLFILFIWIFAAVTGVSITIIPLIFGRSIFKFLIPAHIRTNDIYAFSIGIYILGSAAYGLFHLRELWLSVRKSAAGVASAAWDHAAARRVASAVARVAKLVYTYFFLLFVFPLLVASLMELYCLIPLDTYMYSALFAGGGGITGGGGLSVADQAAGTPVIDAAATGSRHTIRVIQAWTIGLLYLKLAVRVTNSWYEDSWVAAALRAVLRQGWLNPNVGVLTRVFIVPGLAASAAAIAAPLAAAHTFLNYTQNTAEENLVNPTLVYRLSFPVAALSVVIMSMAWATLGVFRSWRVRIRDEAYLIGERLHNFGATSSGAQAPTPGAMNGNGNHNHPRARVAWREGGAVAI